MDKKGGIRNLVNMNGLVLHRQYRQRPFVQVNALVVREVDFVTSVGGGGGGDGGEVTVLLIIFVA